MAEVKGNAKESIICLIFIKLNKCRNHSEFKFSINLVVKKSSKVTLKSGPK